MELTIQLSPKTVRKMRALAALQEGSNQDFLGLVESYIDRLVTEQIMSELDVEQVVMQQSVMQSEPTNPYGAVDSLSNESYDDNEEEPDVKAPPARVTLADVAKDNMVMNPKVEAISPDNQELSFEEAFADDLRPSHEDDNPFRQIPELPPVSAKPPRVNKRSLPKNIKAVVSAYEGGER